MITTQDAEDGSGRSFRLVDWHSDEQQIDGCDYDVNAHRNPHRHTASDESGLLALIAEWGVQPTRFNYSWDTDDPGRRGSRRRR